jgi:hypothetical protein
MLSAGSILGPLEVEISRLSPQASGLPEAILAFAATILWVTLALIALIVFREPIAKFLSTIGGRVSKISFAGIELELATAPSVQLNPEAVSFGNMDPQNVANDSTSETLKKALDGRAVPHAYAILDLGTGTSWLISRLFIFAVMLRLVRGVQCFVFVNGSGGPGSYLGAIATEDIRTTLAQKYPWLERVFAKAYKDQLWKPLPPAAPEKPITSQGTGMLNKDLAAVIAQEFVVLLKQDWKGLAAFPNVTAEPNYNVLQIENSSGPWVSLGTSVQYGGWVDGDLLLSCFDGVIQTERVLQRTSAEEKVRRILSSTAPYLAEVGDSGEFVSLIDRCKVMAELSKCPSSRT